MKWFCCLSEFVVSQYLPTVPIIILVVVISNVISFNNWPGGQDTLYSVLLSRFLFLAQSYGRQRCSAATHPSVLFAKLLARDLLFVITARSAFAYCPTLVLIYPHYSIIYLQCFLKGPLKSLPVVPVGVALNFPFNNFQLFIEICPECLSVYWSEKKPTLSYQICTFSSFFTPFSILL